MRTDISPPYDWFTNRPNPTNQDFHNVMAWLKDHGAPDPKQVYLDLTGGGFPVGATNPGPLLMFQYPSLPQPLDASLVMNTPGAALVALGLGWTNYEPPAVPAPPPPPPPGQPANPIGNYWFTDHDGLKVFYPAPGDTSPDKMLYRDGGLKLYIKSLIPGPWGDYASWKLLN
jgi:hypothetical protein